MTVFTVKRTHNITEGSFGVIDCEGVPFAVTLENYKLRIPKGEYICKKAHYYGGGYDTYEITGVVGRTHILFHKGNVQDNSLGCILLAESFGTLNSKIAVLDSKGGFQEFMAKCNGAEEVRLVVLEV